MKTNKVEDKHILEVKPVSDESDVAEGMYEGRCDLLPIEILAPMMENNVEGAILSNIGKFIKTHHPNHLYQVLYAFAALQNWEIPRLILEAAYYNEWHYNESEWTDDTDVNHHIDLALRSYLKNKLYQSDVDHRRIFVCEILKAICIVTNGNISMTNPQESQIEDSPEHGKPEDINDMVSIPRSELEQLVGMVSGVYDAMGIPVPADIQK